MSAEDALAVRYLIYGRLVSEAVCTFAALGLPDMIGESGCGTAELAERAHLVADRVEDLLRLLAVCGLVRLEGAHVRLTERGRYLRADRPGSALPTALLARHSVGRAWDGLETTLRTGRPAFDAYYDRPFFDEIDHDPWLRAVFDDSQVGGLVTEVDTLAALIDGRGYRRIVDIGGGDGYLVTRLLERFPAVTGIVLDRAAAIQRAGRLVAERELTHRCECVVGDFFLPLDLELDARDLLIMRHICHDWDDEVCTAVLANCRAAMARGGRLIVIEHVAEHAERIDPMAAIMSLYMATVTSGRERTRAEYEKLHAAAGLTTVAVTATDGACFIESTVPSRGAGDPGPPGARTDPA